MFWNASRLPVCKQLHGQWDPKGRARMHWLCVAISKPGIKNGMGRIKNVQWLLGEERAEGRGD